MSLLAFVLAVLTFGFAAGPPVVSKVDPPNWWTGFVSPVTLLLYGENMAGASVSASYAGVRVQNVEAQPDGKHVFVTLAIASNAKPGSVSLAIKTVEGSTQVSLPILQRSPQTGRFQGVTQDDVIYLIMPDRFADADQLNDKPSGAAPGSYDRNAPKAYHGGDLKGIKEHLAYLKQLGITTLWLTPLYDNDNSTSDYHGYGAVDLYKVEDHFGTMADFAELVAASHQQGIKVLLDMVPNHVGPKHPWAASQPTPGWLHGTTENHFDTDYNYAPISDPHAVPHNYRSALEGWFANVLPDLAQENAQVAQYLLQNALWWTESSGIDGFRIDTFPYVPRSFWNYYLKNVYATYPNFFTVGEIYNPDPTVTSYWAGGHTGFDGIDTLLSTPFDFPMNDAIHRVVARGESAKAIVSVLRQDRLFPHPELLVTFIGNHDMPRFITEAGGSRNKLKLAFSLLATLRGIPQLYYADEIGMPGGKDPDDRHDVPGGFPGDQHNAFEAGTRTADEEEVFAHVQSLLRLRHEHVALRRGAQKHVVVADDYYVFTREAAGERLMVVFNNGTQPQTITVDLSDTSIANARSFTPIFAGAPVQQQGTKLQLQLAPMSLALYRVE